jgi:hypothetical protein
VASGDRVLLGAHGMYEARCRRCFDPLLTSERSAAQAAAVSMIPESNEPRRV